MGPKSHYSNLLNTEFFSKYYIDKRMSFPAISKMLAQQGHNIPFGTLHKYAKRLGFGRTISESRRNLQEDPIDWKISFLNENMIEAIDGFVLGDGSIQSNPSMTAGRLTCGVEHQEFCLYMMDFFKSYKSTTSKYDSSAMNQGFCWCGNSLHHPDLYAQYVRWYPEINNKREKQPPDDVRITPTSVMIWYLGDGSVVQSGNSIALRLSTDSFLPERVEFLAHRLQQCGIDCHRNNDNRVFVEAKGIPSFFKFIGTQSPIKCYDYKFDLPEWRLESKRMKQVATELNIDYNRLCYFVKIGKINTYRASDKGKPRFLPQHIDEVKRLIELGEL